MEIYRCETSHYIVSEKKRPKTLLDSRLYWSIIGGLIGGIITQTLLKLRVL